VEVIFTADGAGTRLTLTHRGWENRREEAQKFRDGYYVGWGVVLGKWEAAGG
jgi:hypothetical protein